MNHAAVPILKVGTPFQKPSWRIQAADDPDKFGFRSLCSRPRNRAGHLKRYIVRGVEATGVYEWPQYFQNMSEGLDQELKDCLVKLWNRYFEETHGDRIQYHIDFEENQLVSWNLRKIEEINDIWFKKLLKHRHGLECDDAIGEALKMSRDKENSQIFTNIGDWLFAGLSDADIAKKFNKPVKVIKAIRYLFYDFSAFPKDKVAQWIMIRQLKENDDITDHQFMMYKRIFDFKGELGIKSIYSAYALTDEEAAKVRDFLSESAVSNMLNINFCIRTQKQMWEYSKTMNELGKMSLQRAEMKQREQLARLTELHITEKQKELNIGKEEIQEEDMKLLSESIASMSKFDADPRFKKFSDLHQIPK